MKTPAKQPRLTAKIDDRIPAHRDSAVDGLRTSALLAVPTGHGLLGGFTLGTAAACATTARRPRSARRPPGPVAPRETR
ncbi:hypothetical protein [Streptomyces sp. NPDC004629]|uniref:hypothetical protein n=1 Tax=Streptomyces sp. NPDC004629 TaxID=3364705 RepID=UPI0036ACCA2A